jgi:MFS family permease
MDNFADYSEIQDEMRPLLESQRSIRQQSSNLNESYFLRSLFDPRKKFFRYFSLIFICLLTFGPYFCYVIPSALEKQFEHDLSISTTQYTLFNSLYSWPNIILCFCGGILIDRVFGLKFGTIIFSCTVLLGQFLFGYGAYHNNLWMMYIGRFVFG